MGKLSFGAQRVAPQVALAAQVDPTVAPPQWGKRGVVGDVLDSIFLGGAIRNSREDQFDHQAAAYNAAQGQAQQKQIESTITDPAELALFRANPTEWAKARGSNYEAANVAGGDTRLRSSGAGGNFTAPKLVSDAGVYGTQGVNGYTQTGARGASIAEAHTAAQDDPNTFGGEGWNRVQANRIAQGNLVVNQGQLGVARGQLSLGQQRLGFDQGSAKVPSGYRLSADGRGLEYIPGGPADPNAAKRASPTQDQAMSEFNLNRMRDSTQIIDKMEAAGYDRGAADTGAVGVPWGPTVRPAALLPGTKSNESVRSYDAAAGQWVDSLIRLTTGAAANKDEVRAGVTQYFPQYGDTPAVRAQKAASRRNAMAGAGVRAGPAEGQSARASAPAASGWKIVR